MKKLVLIISVVIIFNSVVIPASGKEITGFKNLVEKANYYDGKFIYFQGEAIGDIMRQKQYFWLNLHDGTEAIGIWGDINSLPEIKYTGDYKHIGDEVIVKGIFHRACKQHHGEMDIHAQEIRIIESGYKVNHPLDKIKLRYAIVLFLLAMTFLIYYKIVKKNI